MSEEESKAKKNLRGSIGKALGMFVLYAVAVLGSLFLFIFLGETPFCVQIATSITYTGFVFIAVFFGTRYLNEAYSLRDERVQQQIPRLLTIHLVFLVSVFAIQTFAFVSQPYLPSYWFKESAKNPNLFTTVLGVTCILLGTTQVVISRGILSRSLEAEKTANPTNEAFKAT